MHPILQVLFEATPWGKINLLEGRLIEAHTTIQKHEVDQHDLMIKGVRLRADAIQARAESVQTFTDMLAIKNKYEMLVEDLKRVTETRNTLIDKHLQLMAKAHTEIQELKQVLNERLQENSTLYDQLQYFREVTRRRGLLIVKLQKAAKKTPKTAAKTKKSKKSTKSST